LKIKVVKNATNLKKLKKVHLFRGKCAKIYVLKRYLITKRDKIMLNIVLLEPEIPHNTGAIARTCAATGARLHLIKPLGFDISDKAVKRCGLDYWHLVDISVYENLDEYLEKNGDENLWLATTKAPHAYCEADFSTDCVSIMLGKETAGLPEDLRMKYYHRCIRIPMVSAARSLNLSNSAAILAYEALRQQGFPGLMDIGSMAES
jgi:tRNA (cytidine/uridine-2'-O-)-methyltransferase